MFQQTENLSMGSNDDYIEMETDKLPKVSVIIPVYNPGPGIERCIESLRNQSLADIEMIFVDDKGTDEAMTKVKNAAIIDKRIRILVNPENLGAGSSRNKGIEAARGEYLSFVDPDDYVALDFLELLYNKASITNSDIVKGKCYYCTETDGQSKITPREKLNHIICKGLEKGTPLFCLFRYEHWTAIYKRSLVIKTARYGTSRVAQDVTFLLQVCSAVNNCMIEDAAIYYYVKRNNSAVHTFTAEQLKHKVLAFKQQCEFLSKHRLNYPDEAAEYVELKVCEYLNYFNFTSCIEGLESISRECVEEVRRILLDFPFAWNAIFRSELLQILVVFHVNASMDVFNYNGEIVDKNEWIHIYQNGVQLIEQFPGLYTHSMKKKLETTRINAYKVIAEYIDKNRLNEQWILNYRKVQENQDLLAKLIVDKKATCKVSVIIPFHNPDIDLFKRCICSLMSQSLNEIEMIFINDDSTNKANEYLNQIKEDDSRISVIVNPINLGPGISRNMGMLVAKGEYLMFMDSDDYIDSEFLEKLYNVAKEKELSIVKGSVAIEKEDGNKINKKVSLNDEILDGIRDNIPIGRRFIYEAFSAIFRKEDVLNKNAKFGGTFYGEDKVFLAKMCWSNESFGIADDALYHYVLNKSSLTNRQRKDYYRQEILALQEHIQFLSSVRNDNNLSLVQDSLRHLLNFFLSIQITASSREDHDAIGFLKDLQELIHVADESRLICRDYVVNGLLKYGINLVKSCFLQHKREFRRKCLMTICRNYVFAIQKDADLVDSEFLQGLTRVFTETYQCISERLLSGDDIVDSYRDIRNMQGECRRLLKAKGIEWKL